MWRVNELIRLLGGQLVKPLAVFLHCAQLSRLHSFRRGQRLLEKRFSVDEGTPLMETEEELSKATEAAGLMVAKACYVLTSGSTGTPKRLLYTARRRRQARQTFLSLFIRVAWIHHLERPVVYVFRPSRRDESLTSLLLREQAPGYLKILFGPDRVEEDPRLRALVPEYGMTAIRLWILCLSQPSIIYATNPSTLVHFFESVSNDWLGATRLLRDFLQSRRRVAGLQGLSRLLCSRGWQQNRERIINSRVALSPADYLPELRACICWTGGYVKPFLRRLTSCLPPSRVAQIPLFSMSSETIETVAHFERGSVRLLPTGRDALYEFLEADGGENSTRLRKPWELKVGREYSMVVSNPFGLLRYRTRDIFRCVGFRLDAPELEFLRREGLCYSFTGEKLTGDHCLAVFAALRAQFRAPLSAAYLTAVPSFGRDAPVPHYRVVAVGSNLTRGRLQRHIEERADRLLCEVNEEYASKRRSGRLARARLVTMTLTSFVRLASGQQFESWEGQFKFLPLYTRTWEQMERSLRGSRCFEGSSSQTPERTSERRGPLIRHAG